VIGKGGANLGAVREQTGVKINFGKEDVKGFRPCSISGGLNNLMNAEALIHNLVLQESQQNPSRKRSAPGPDSFEGPNDTASKRAKTAADIAAAFGPAANFGWSAPDPEPTAAAGSQTKLLVPATSAGAIIGKSGAGLAALREEFGIKVEMLHQAQAPMWTEDRVVMLQGPAPSRQSAVQRILQSVGAADGAMGSFKMLVSKAEAGAIIGKQGSMLRQLREQSGVSVQVQKEEIMGERLVFSSGPLAQILVAARLVMSVATAS